MRYVLDASVAVCWCFHDESDARADAALALVHRSAVAIAPMHWWFEIRNVVMLGVRRNRVTEARVIAFLRDLDETAVVLADIPNENAVFTLAKRHRLTFYDAAYLELAQRERIALATLDGALARAAAAEAVPLVGA